MKVDDEHHAHLRGRVVERLLAERPGSVLDVGCGAGFVLRALTDAGVVAAGVEVRPEQVRELCAVGLTVRQGDAESLPADAGSYDWVTLCHVLHHLRDPGRCLAEAFRVCRLGVLVAEPWFDEGVPAQGLAARIDRWLKRQHRRLGRVHHENLSPANVLALVGDPDSLSVRYEQYLRLQLRPPGYLEAEAEGLVADLNPSGAELAEYRTLVDEARERGVSYNGTMIMSLRRPR